MKIRIAIITLAATSLALGGLWQQHGGSVQAQAQKAAPTKGAPVADQPIVRVYSANLYVFNTDVAAMRRSIAAADADMDGAKHLLHPGPEGRNDDRSLQGWDSSTRDQPPSSQAANSAPGDSPK